MNPVFEDVCTATSPYDFFHRYNNLPARSFADIPKVVGHKGRKYEAVGESYGGNISFGKRFLHIMAIIVMVAAAIFLIPVFFRGYREALVDQIQKQKGVNVHHIPLQPRLWQEYALTSRNSGLLSSIDFRLEHLPGIRKTWQGYHGLTSLKSVACCIRLGFDGGEVKMQLIVTSMKVPKFQLKLEDFLSETLKKEINLESSYIEADYALLVKKTDGEIITYSQNKRFDAKFAQDGINEKKIEFTEFDTIDSSVLEEIGFSGECVDSEGNFKEGKYFLKI